MFDDKDERTALRCQPGGSIASVRTGGPYWRIRPIINGVIDETRAKLFSGSLDEAIIEVNWRHALTGIEHAMREVRS